MVAGVTGVRVWDRVKVWWEGSRAPRMAGGQGVEGGGARFGKQRGRVCLA